jgi:hypothetical protein
MTVLFRAPAELLLTNQVFDGSCFGHLVPGDQEFFIFFRTVRLKGHCAALFRPLEVGVRIGSDLVDHRHFHGVLRLGDFIGKLNQGRAVVYRIIERPLPMASDDHGNAH